MSPPSHVSAACPQLGLHLTVIELPGGHEAPTMAAIADRCTLPLRVASVLELVASVQRRLGPDGRICCLDLVGHGEPGVLSVGATPGCPAGHRIDGDPASYGYLGVLRDRFCAGGQLRLLGCSTAQRVPQSAVGDGPLLLLALARFLDVAVGGSLRPVGARDFEGTFMGADQLLTMAPDALAGA